MIIIIQFKWRSIMPILFLTIPLILFLIFFSIERRTVCIGFFFLGLTVYLSFLTAFYFDFYEKRVAFTILIILVGIIIVLVPFYILSFIITLISSGVQLVKREGPK